MRAKVLIKRILVVVVAILILGICGASAQEAPLDNPQNNVNQSVQNNTPMSPYGMYNMWMLNPYSLKHSLLPCFCGCPCCSNGHAMYLWLSFEVIHNEEQ